MRKSASEMTTIINTSAKYAHFPRRCVFIAPAVRKIVIVIRIVIATKSVVLNVSYAKVLKHDY